MELIDEQNHLAVGVGDFLQHGLEALFEFPAVLRAGHQRTHVETDDAFVLEALGHVPSDDPLGQSLDDRGLADARLTDEDRVVLGPARQDLDDAANFFVTPDDRIELPVAGQFRQVATVAFQRLVLALGRLVGDALRAADADQGFENAVSRHAQRRQHTDRFAAPLFGGDGQQQVFGADELVLHALRFALGGGQDCPQARRGSGLRLRRAPGEAGPSRA